MLKLRSTQVPEKEHSMSADEDDEGSSYGSGHSSEDIVETTTIAVPVGASEDLAALLGGIAQLARGQAIVLEKMSFLEKLVGTVQFDMIRVRDDMTSVHQAVDRFADYVCDIQDEAGDVERLKEQESLEGSARQGWKGKELALDYPPAPSVTNSHGGGQYVRNDVASHMEGGNYMADTHPLVQTSVTHTGTLALIETGRREWGYERPTSPDMGSPQCQQTRPSIEREFPQEESQQIEMSCQSTQLPTPATSRSMWNDFTAAVRDWPAPTMAVTEREEGWVSAKKGRWDLAVYGKENVDTGSAQMLEEHGTLNLNLMPENEGPVEKTRGRGCVAASTGITGASKNTSGGAWRGTARGRRPPALQPRYSTSVRVVWFSKLCGSDCMLVRT